MWHKSKHRMFAVATAFAAVAAGLLAPAMAEELVVTGPGGNTLEVWQETIYDPFTAETGISVVSVPLGGDEALARAIAELQSPSLDIYQFPGGQETEVVARGLAQSAGDLQAAKVGAAYHGPNNEWLGVMRTLNGILYNTDKIAEQPKSILDLLKPEYAGKVGIPAPTNARGIAFILELAKANGGDEDNIEPGLELIKQLLDNGAQIYTKAGQLQSMMAQDEIWITYYDLNNSLAAADQGLPIKFVAPSEGMTVIQTVLAVAKNTSKADAAKKLIAFILRPDRQLALAEAFYSFPVVEGLSVSSEFLERANITEDDLNNIVEYDSDTVNQRRADWIERFNAVTLR